MATMNNRETSQTLPGRRVAIVTSTRADWGLLSGIARGLDSREDVDLSVIATNMHLDPRFGCTVDEILADGISVSERVEMTPESDSPADTARATARCLDGMAGAFERLRPDLLLILGDRYEMLAVATAATLMRIPIAHIAGGEISEGAIDDNIRHALTKLSSLHFTATEPYRHRVIAMGEAPERVINAGAIGVYNLSSVNLLTKEELESSIGMPLDSDTLLVTMHPATADDGDVAGRMQSLLDALDRFLESKILFTYPNNDARGEVIIRMIHGYADRWPGRVWVVPSLGRRRYLSALRCVGAVVGNSSSGIVEVPSAGIPTVDIGMRQRGRIAAESVIHAGDDADSIASAISMALSLEFRKLAAEVVNPYYRPDTLRAIVEAVATYPLEALRRKKFYDITLPDNI